jgi:hypothetical protein
VVRGGVRRGTASCCASSRKFQKDGRRQSMDQAPERVVGWIKCSCCTTRRLSSSVPSIHGLAFNQFHQHPTCRIHTLWFAYLLPLVVLDCSIARYCLLAGCRCHCGRCCGFVEVYIGRPSVTSVRHCHRPRQVSVRTPRE